MARKRHLLSFVTDSTGTHLTVHADAEGVRLLISELQQLHESLVVDDCPHTHLFAPESFGELTNTKLEDQELEVNVVNHVKLYGWNEEWAEKHGLRTEQMGRVGSKKSDD